MRAEIPRRLVATLGERLADVPAVALLGPRQVGKTTLALAIAADRPSVYLDLESPADRARLSEPELYFADHVEELVILDEVQRTPELFQSLRGAIDRGRRAGRRVGRFLLLGSASMDLLRQSSESLAGRLSTLELTPLDVLEVDHELHDALWVRGGFPDSLLARSGAASWRWRLDFIRTYLERDIPQLGPRIAAETLRRFWTMLAHHQGGLLNAAALARGLAVSGKTLASYLDLMVDLLLVRRLPPWHGNIRKRLVKSPKVYVRDTGLMHALLGIRDKEALLGHPAVGPSYETFVLETLLGVLPSGAEACFFRSAAGAEIDLVLDLPDGQRWAIEVKRSLSPSLTRGFHTACEHVAPTARFVVYPGAEPFPLRRDVEAIPLPLLASRLSSVA